jgi:hypothetical protein
MDIARDPGSSFVEYTAGVLGLEEDEPDPTMRKPSNDSSSCIADRPNYKLIKQRKI